MKKMSGALSLFLIILLSILFARCSQGISSTTNANPIVPVFTTDISNIKVASKDNNVIVGNIDWKIIEVKDLGNSIRPDNANYLQSKIGKFVYLRFTVKNSGQNSVTIYDLNIIDSKGHVYSICLPAYAYIGNTETCAVAEVRPNVSETFSATFDIPVDSTGLVLQVTDLLYPPTSSLGQKSYIDLGF
jgi:hypothetical protein